MTTEPKDDPKYPIHGWHHPSVFMREELDARAWTLDDLAREMGGDFGVNRVGLDFYFLVGPKEPAMRMGEEVIQQYAKAFGVSPDFFRNLENAWLDYMHRSSARGAAQ